MLFHINGKLELDDDTIIYGVDGATFVVLTIGAGGADPQININATTNIRRVATLTLNGVTCSMPSIVRTINADTNRNPVITVNEADRTVCASGVAGLVFTANITGGLGTEVYQWSVNGANVGSNLATFQPSAGAITDGQDVSVTVTSAAPYGCTYTSAVPIRINVDPDPVAGLSSNKTRDAICSGDSITFTAGPTGQANYAFFVDGSLIPDYSGPVNTFTTNLSSTSSVRVEVTNTGGCTDDETINVTVPELTTGGSILIDTTNNFTGTVTTTAFCAGANNLFIDGTSGGAIATSVDSVTYRWSFSTNGGATFTSIAGQTSSNLASGTITIIANTTVRRTSYATVSGTLLLCDPQNDDVSFTVTARTPAISSAENSGTANDDIICSGAAVTFTATIAGYDAGNDVIAWLVNDVVIPGQVGSSLTTTTLTAGQGVKYRVTTNAAAGGCIFESSEIPITVLDPPAATLTSNKSLDSVCSGDSITFTAGPTGQANYAFFVDGSLTPDYSGSVNTFTTNLSSTSSVRVEVTNTGGCTDDETINVTVPELTTGGSILIDTTNNFTGTVTTTAFCAGANNLYIDGTSGGAIATSVDSVTYRWSFSTNGGATFTSIAGQTSSNLASGTITIIANTTVRRTSYATVSGALPPLLCDPQNDDVSFTVTARTPAISSAENSGTANDDIICSGAAVTFTATIAGYDAGNDVIAWLVNDVVIPGQVGSSLTTTTLTAGQGVKYRVTTNAAAGGCIFESSEIPITVLDPPAATLTSNKSLDSVCSGDSITFTAGPTGQANYAFFVDGSLTPDYSGPVNTFTTNLSSTSSVRVEVTNTGGCTDDETINVTVPELTTGGSILIDTTNNFTGTVTTTAFCAGANNLYIDGTSGGAIATSVDSVTYRWSFSTNGGATFTSIAGQTSSNLASGTITIIANTTVRRTSYATVSGALPPLLCDPQNDDVSFTVTARTPAISSAENSGTANDDIICSGAAVTFTATIAGYDAGNDVIAWLVNDVVIPGQVGSSLTTTTLTAGQGVKYRVTTNAAAGGCIFESSEIPITVLDPPAATLTSNKSLDSVCSGDSITFTAGPTGQANYAFFVDGSLTPDYSGPVNTFTTNLSSTSSVRVEVTNTGGCTDDETINVTVPELTTGGSILIDTTNNFTGTVTTTAFCAGANNLFIDGTSGGAIATSVDSVTYRWSFSTNGGATFTSIAGQTSSNLASGTITIIANTTVRRTSYATVSGALPPLLCDPQNDDVSFTVTARTPAISSAENSGTANDDIICSGAAVTFTATIAGYDAGNDVIAWLVNDVVIPGQVGSSLTTTTLTAGQGVKYRVTTNAAAGGCIFESSEIPITVLDPPAATLTSNKSLDSVCSGDSITFTAGPTGQANYAFFVDGSLTPDYSGSVNTFTTNLSSTSSVRVEVTNTGGCTDDETINVTVPELTTGGSILIDTTNNFTGTVTTTAFCAGANNLYIDGTSGGAIATSVDSVTYRWSFSTNGGATFTSIAGQTSSNLASGTITIIANTTVRRTSYATVSGALPPLLCDPQNDDVSFTVTARTPAISSAENSGTANDDIICSGAAVTFTATIAGYDAGNDVIAWLVNDVVIPGQVGSSLTTTTLTAGQGVKYRVTTNAAAGGCIFESSEIPITVLDPPAATLTSNKSLDSVCSGDSITFTAGPTGQANYAFFVDGSLTPDYSGPVNTFTTNLSSTSSVRVEVTNTGGCTDDETINVTVPELTTGGSILIDTTNNFTGTVTTTAFCAGANNLYIDGTSGGAIATSVDSVTYRWSFSTNGGATFTSIAGQTSSNLASGTITIIANTTVRRTSYATVSGALPPLLCDPQNDDVSFTVTARTPAISSAENSGTANDDIICSGAAVTFTATIAGYDAGNDVIAWLVNDVVIPGQVGSSLTTTTLTAGQGVKYRVTTNAAAGGCIFESSEIPITVLDPPAATLTSNKSLDSVCSGDSITFTAGPTGQANYTFFVDGSLTPDYSGPVNTFTTNLSSTSSVRVEVTNTGGCTDDETINVTVPELTTGGSILIDTTNNFTGTVTTTAFCAGANNLFIDGTSGGAIATSVDSVTYRWSFSTNGGATFTSIAGQTSSNLASGTITIIANTTVRRTSYATVSGTLPPLLCDPQNDDVSFTVTARTPAISSAENSGTANDDIICSGAAVTFTATIAGYDAGNDVIAWLVNDVVIPGQVGSSLTTTTLTAGQGVKYRVTTNAAAGGCIFESSEIPITVLDPPAATLTSNKSLDSVCSGDSITFTAGPTGQANYAFFVDGSLTPDYSGPVNTFTTNLSSTSSVRVEVTNTGGCTDDETINVTVPELTTGGSILIDTTNNFT